MHDANAILTWLSTLPAATRAELRAGAGPAGLAKLAPRVFAAYARATGLAPLELHALLDDPRRQAVDAAARLAEDVGCVQRTRCDHDP